MNPQDFGERMKTYENVSKNRLVRKIPVAIRIDGRAFHTFTTGFKRPFDDIFTECMQETMRYLCSNIQGCVLGYTQSDEITLILIDYKNRNTSAWFDYGVQKLCSISASMATMKFNQIFAQKVYSFDRVKDEKYFNSLVRAMVNGAQFDSRCFNIPKEEVANLIYWRQIDAVKNSTQMIGRAYFSHKELQNKSNKEIATMLLDKANISVSDFPDCNRYGSCCIRNDEGKWLIDNNIPIFKESGRYYIERFIYLEQEKI